MNYGSMSVHELVGELAELGTGPVVRFEPIDWGTVTLIESALRKAVVREASVGKLVFGTHEIPDVVNTDLSHIETTIRFDWCENERHPDALTEDLLLIPTPKETP